MKLRFHNPNKPGVLDADIKDGILYFTANNPMVIQPEEIMRVPTGTALQVEKGYVLTISTAPELALRVAELFPATLVLDHTSPEAPLELPVKNNGRNAIHLMPGEALARGYVSRVEAIEVEEFEPKASPSGKSSKSRPSKKNPNVQFEMT